jgi:hypothetical protein
MLEELKAIEESLEKKELVQQKAPIVQLKELSPAQLEYNRQMQVAHTLSRSTIVPIHFRNKPDDIYACVMLGAELGFQPMMSLNSIVIIQGNVTLKAQTMLAVVRSKCQNAIITITPDETNKIVTVKAQRDINDPGYTSTWNLDKAKAMGLLSKDNYIKQPMTMLRWRACSESIRMVFADVLMGIHSTEELQDVEELKTVTAKLATEVFSG